MRSVRVAIAAKTTAGAEAMKTAADATGTLVLGTLNNCANGKTPWGTYLTCEENFNGYFGSTDPAYVRTALERRYGVNTSSSYRWHEVDERFDISKNPNEPNRFGWIVEIDPFNPTSTPKKRTALGRFKHENAEVVIAPDGRAVVYMGDDRANDYIYKFVSEGKYDAADPAANRDLLAVGNHLVRHILPRFLGVSFPGQDQPLVLQLLVAVPTVAALVWIAARSWRAPLDWLRLRVPQTHPDVVLVLFGAVTLLGYLLSRFSIYAVQFSTVDATGRYLPPLASLIPIAIAGAAWRLAQHGRTGGLVSAAGAARSSSSRAPSKSSERGAAPPPRFCRDAAFAAFAARPSTQSLR